MQRTAADMDLRTITTMKMHTCHRMWSGATQLVSVEWRVLTVSGQWRSAVYYGAQDILTVNTETPEAYGCCPWSDDCLVFTVFNNDPILLGESFCKGCSHPLTSLIHWFGICKKTILGYRKCSWASVSSTVAKPRHIHASCWPLCRAYSLGLVFSRA